MFTSIVCGQKGAHIRCSIHNVHCRAVVKEVQGMYPSSVLMAAGWSLGGKELPQICAYTSSTIHMSVHINRCPHVRVAAYAQEHKSWLTSPPKRDADRARPCTWLTQLTIEMVTGMQQTFW